MQKPIKNVLVNGGNVYAWLTALYVKRCPFANLGGSAWQISVINSESETDHGPILISPMEFRWLLHLGVSERHLLKECDARFALGFRYGDSESEKKYFCWGEYGFNEQGLSSAQIWQKYKNIHIDSEYHDLSFAAVCAREGKFVHPRKDKRSILSTFDYGVFCCAKRLSNYLRELCLGAGVEEQVTSVVSVNKDNSGSLVSVETLGSQTIATDLLLDASLSAAVFKLATDCREVDNNAVNAFSKATIFSDVCDNNISVYDYIKLGTGWLVKQPVGNGQYISVLYKNGQFPWQDCESIVGTALVDELKNAKQTPVCMSAPLSKTCENNIVACGLSGFPPLDFVVSPLYVLHHQLETFLQMVPSAGQGGGLSEEYNRINNILVARLVEIFYLHFSSEKPDVLSNTDIIIELFCARGSIVQLESSVLSETDWQKLLRCLNFEPQKYSPLLDHIDFEPLEAKISAGVSAIEAMMEKLPAADTYRKLCIKD